MERVKYLVSKNALIIIYVIFFIGFTSFAVWDVKEIVEDYIQDNTLTVVNPKHSIKDGFPFLDKLRLTYLYDQPIIPNISWNEFAFMLNDSWHQREIVWPRNMSYWEKSESRKIFDIIKYSLIKDIDQNSSGKSIDTMAKILRIDKTDVHALVDAFIKKTQNVNLLKNVAIDPDQLSNWFIYRALQNTSNNITIDFIRYEYFGDRTNMSVGFTAPLSDDMMTLKKRSQEYDLNIHYHLDNFNLSLSQTIDATPIIRIDFLGEEHRFKNARAKNGEALMIWMQIFNSRIFDNQRLSYCNSEFRKEEDCHLDLQQSIIEKLCQCKQFSKVLQERYFSNNSKSIEKPFCTMQTYEKCHQKAIIEYGRQKETALKNDACKPCLTATNYLKVNYMYIHSYSYSDDFGIYPRYNLKIECKEETYLIFEEKPQFTFPHLVSQIGGDLGLYIGFSMISILQLILFFYHMYQQRLNYVYVNGSSSSKWADWFKFYFRYVASSFKNEVEANGVSLLELKKDFNLMKRQQEETVKEMKKVNDQMEKIEKLLMKQIEKVVLLHKLKIDDEDQPQQTKL